MVSTAGSNIQEMRRQIGQGFELLRQGRMDAAAELRDRLLGAAPDNAEVLFLASEVHFASDELEPALERINAAIAAAPGQLPLLLKQARILLPLRRRAQLRELLAHAQDLAGNEPNALWSVGRLYARAEDPQTAAQLYLGAQQRGIRDPALLYDLALAQFFTGQFDEAEANLASVIAAQPQFGPALHLRSVLRKQTLEHNHVDELRARLAAGMRAPDGEAACLYALAKELEDLGQAEESFEALGRAASTLRGTLNYDAAAELASIEEIRTRCTADWMSAPSAGHEEEGAIFIVGMPRTGTTLLERMLGRHSQVRSAGELQDFAQVLAGAARQRQAEAPGSTLVQAALGIDMQALGRDYMQGARQAAPGSACFIDKMPVNFLYSGFIHKALPKARILHLQRDPMDSCYAVYKTLFHNAYFFSNDLDELAEYYIAYTRLMQHWRTAMPEAILDVRYEDLVRDPELQARRVLAWCGLDWQDAVLQPDANERPSSTASAAQVRGAIHGESVQKWRQHEAALAPLQQRLRAAGVVE